MEFKSCDSIKGSPLPVQRLGQDQQIIMLVYDDQQKVEIDVVQYK